jgi:hypothetical protein
VEVYEITRGLSVCRLPLLGSTQKGVKSQRPRWRCADPLKQLTRCTPSRVDQCKVDYAGIESSCEWSLATLEANAHLDYIPDFEIVTSLLKLNFNVDKVLNTSNYKRKKVHAKVHRFIYIFLKLYIHAHTHSKCHKNNIFQSAPIQIKYKMALPPY